MVDVSVSHRASGALFPPFGRLSATLRSAAAALHRLVFAGLLCGLLAGAGAAPLRDRLTLLVPDGASLSAWPVKVWTDSAAEEGLRMDVLTDSAFLAMGVGAANQIAALVLPDSAHLNASDALVAAVKAYVAAGGKLMLVYDAGALTARGFFPATGNSRFSDLAGVQYVLWANGAGANTMVGFGPVVGTQARLDKLSFAPGKYMPWTGATPTPVPSALAFGGAALDGSATPQVAYVPTSQYDAGGSALMAPVLAQRSATIAAAGTPAERNAVRTRLPATEGLGLLRWGPRRGDASNTLPAVKTASVLSAGGALASPAAAALPGAANALYAVSGYLYGPLSYYSYVTTGLYTGTAYLSSPSFGLVAGLKGYGAGQVLFVNLPLGFFKAIGTDGAPLHGFLSQFARDQVGLASVSLQPRAKGGLVYNWHVDDGPQLLTDARSLLNTTTIFRRGPFSIHFTAGPDVITPGDKGGMALATNATAQDLVRRLGNLGSYANLPAAQKLAAHELGSHGGWIHDYWGNNANEANNPNLTSLLTQNFNAIQGVTGRAIREYSSPQGNTPQWAINWLEAKGVVGMYLVGDIGSGVVRSWRNGARVSNKLWSFPVSPLGTWATFEEFEENGVTDAVSGQWLLDLQSFVVSHRTARLFYNHPPGAAGHLTPLNALMTKADTLQAAGSFAWYTMAQLADFAQRRVETTWSTSVSGSNVTFTASHPTALADVTWMLPKATWGTPTITAGNGTVVTTDASHWLVTVNSGKTLTFRAAAL